MIFTSIAFFAFFVLFFILYWFVVDGKLKAQNALILGGSYVFYAWWDWRFLFLLAGSTLVSYLLGIGMAKAGTRRMRQWMLTAGLVESLGVLVLFKYYNFFAESLVQSFERIHVHVDLPLVSLVLPLGISFYTFRILSYLLDIHKGKLKPTHDWIIYFSYVAFFPSLVSGPIDRAGTLIPQLETPRSFSYEMGVDGLQQILWGLFKKMVVADNCGKFVDPIFANYNNLPASSLVIGAVLYSIQIYADFSGYSDMAIGFARLLGFSITKNFNFPYFSRNIAEYWQRWHISLTGWLTDYVFTPLAIAFRDWGKAGLLLAIFIDFTAIGLWHGAKWTFIFFDVAHACYFIPLVISGNVSTRRKKARGKTPYSLKEWLSVVRTFLLVTLAFVFFRAETISQAFGYLRGMFSRSLFSVPPMMVGFGVPLLFLFIVVMLVMEWYHRDKEHGLQLERKGYPVLRLGIYCFLLLSIVFLGATSTSGFIYFKF